VKENRHAQREKEQCTACCPPAASFSMVYPVLLNSCIFLSGNIRMKNGIEYITLILPFFHGNIPAFQKTST
jgi:hypothetical protein